jgi:NAD(P)H dehydrogenase (quinone)
MNHLVVIGHPNPKSFNMALLGAYTSALEARGHQVFIRDLYALKFDPILKAEDFLALQKGYVLEDVAMEQAYIRKAEVITFISPIWWVTLTPMLKGYVDRVFSHGFSYNLVEHVPKGLLTDKRAMLITTSGARREQYEENGFLKAIHVQICEGIMKFSGMEVVAHVHFGGVVAATDDMRKQMLREIQEAAEVHF